MPEGNAWKYRPERQARLIADMGNPELRRRSQMWKAARGKVLDHFKKRDLIAQWNIDWNQKGRPADHPDFPVWLEQNRERLTRQRNADRAATEASIRITKRVFDSAREDANGSPS